MIDFRNNSARAASSVIVLSIIALFGLLIFLLVVPEPRFQPLDAARREREFKTIAAIRQSEAVVRTAEDTLVRRTWSGDDQTVGPRALDSITAMIEREKLKLVSFRPQRKATDGTLERLPFVLSIQGPYPSVVKLVRDIENPATRLVVNQVQITALDGETSFVNATIGLAAYLAPKEQAN